MNSLRNMCAGAGHPLRVISGLIIVVLAAMAVPGHAEIGELAAGLSPQERDLLEEYLPNFERLRGFYNNVHMEAICRESEFDAYRSGENPDGRRATRLVYRANGGKFFRIDASPLNVVDESPTGALRVGLVRPNGYLIASRKAADQPLIVTDWGVDRNWGASLVLTHKFHEAPYTASYFWVKGLLLHRAPFLQTAELEEVTGHEEGGERLVTIAVRGVTKVGERDWLARCVFYRDKCWALKEAKCGAAELRPEDENTLCQYEYEGMHDGVPLLKRAKYWREVGPVRRVCNIELYEIQEVTPDPVAEEEFSPEAVGLTIGRQRNVWVRRLILALNGIFLLLVCLILRRGKRKTPGRGAEGGEGQ